MQVFKQVEIKVRENQDEKLTGKQGTEQNA